MACINIKKYTDLTTSQSFQNCETDDGGAEWGCKNSHMSIEIILENLGPI